MIYYQLGNKGIKDGRCCAPQGSSLPPRDARAQGQLAPSRGEDRAWPLISWRGTTTTTTLRVLHISTAVTHMVSYLFQPHRLRSQHLFSPVKCGHNSTSLIGFLRTRAYVLKPGRNKESARRMLATTSSQGTCFVLGRLISNLCSSPLRTWHLYSLVNQVLPISISFLLLL